MEVICIMCGRKEGIDPEHVNYRKFEDNPKAVYICTLCNARTFNDAKEGQKPVRPI